VEYRRIIHRVFYAGYSWFDKPRTLNKLRKLEESACLCSVGGREVSTHPTSREIFDKHAYAPESTRPFCVAMRSTLCAFLNTDPVF
jgi:hypothetical protein